MQCINSSLTVNVSLKSRVREKRKHGSVGVTIALKLILT